MRGEERSRAEVRRSRVESLVGSLVDRFEPGSAAADVATRPMMRREVSEDGRSMVKLVTYLDVARALVASGWRPPSDG